MTFDLIYNDIWFNLKLLLIQFSMPFDSIYIDIWINLHIWPIYNDMWLNLQWHLVWYDLIVTLDSIYNDIMFQLGPFWSEEIQVR